jgi:hypothetical protein
MRLVDYIQEGYNIVTSLSTGRKIKDAYPDVLVFTDMAFDGIPCEKLLVDRYYANHSAVISAKPLQKAFAVEMFTHDFVGIEPIIPLTSNTRERVMKAMQKSVDELITKSPTNLLEIKLKDTDSVPEVWYRGKRVDEMPNGLVDAYIHWHTCEADKPTELVASLEYVEGTDIDAKRVEVYIDEEGERGSFNLLKDEIDD